MNADHPLNENLLLSSTRYPAAVSLFAKLFAILTS